MGLSHSPSVITDGLICYLDAANTKSYVSGATITDLSGNGHNATITGTFTVSNGAFTFNGAGNYATVGTINLSAANSKFTVMGSSRFTGATKGRIITANANNWLLGAWGASTENYYSEGWVSGAGSGADDQVWRIMAATGDMTTDTYAFYTNGISQNAITNGGSAGPNVPVINGTAEPSIGQCGFLMVYNRVLSANEVKHNFNSLRVRYGI